MHLEKVCGVDDRLQVIGPPVFLLVVLRSGLEHAIGHVCLVGTCVLLVTDMHKLTCHAMYGRGFLLSDMCNCTMVEPTVLEL